MREKGRNGDCQNRSGNESRGMGRSLSLSLSFLLSLSVSWFCLIDSCVFLVFKQLGLCRLFVVFFFFFFFTSILQHISSYLSNMHVAQNNASVFFSFFAEACLQQ